MNGRHIALACEATDAADPDARLIALAGVVVQHGGLTGETFHALIDPQVPIPRSGTCAHGHSHASLAGCPTWAEVAPQWMAFAQGAHLIVWHAGFHLRCLDRAQTQAGLPGMHALARHITDLRNAWTQGPDSHPPRLQTLLTLHHIHSDPERNGPQQQARQLAQLWLAMTAAVGQIGNLSGFQIT